MATKAAHIAFNRSVSKYLESIGAELKKFTVYYGEWELNTTAGILHLTMKEPERSEVFSLYGRFKTPIQATDLLIHPEQKVHLNPNSGKWNFHSYDAKELLEEFKEQIAPLLINEKV